MRVYCAECGERWLDENVDTCPNCKRDICGRCWFEHSKYCSVKSKESDKDNKTMPNEEKKNLSE